MIESWIDRWLRPQAKENTDEKDSFVDELKPGTKLMHGQYTIENFLNAGGFGITYLARDSLDRKIVIKECFPGAFCRRSRYVVQARSRAHQNELKSIVRLFVQEARSLAKLDHPNIVGVHQVFEDNDTAYMALDFVEGRDLLDTIEDPNHGLTPAQIKLILKEVLGAVGFIHDQGILHRDISPDNILINKEFHPVLIDFGAAREEATKQSRVLSALRVVKDGYSPQEFYIAGSEQSPSSDLYALSASFYHLINGDVPPNSQARLAAIASGEPDPYVPLGGRFPDYEPAFLSAMDKALAVLPKDRVQSANDWLRMMDGELGNVTPLKVNAVADTAATDAVPLAASSEQQPKSKMPMLLGSAAAVALIIGAGAFTMIGSDSAPVVDVAPVVAETAVVAETPVAVETPAPAAVAEAPEVTEAPELPFLTPAPIEEPVVAEAPAPVVEPPAPTVAEELAAEVAETPVPEAVATPEIVPVLPPAAPLETAEAPVVVEGPRLLTFLHPRFVRLFVPKLLNLQPFLSLNRCPSQLRHHAQPRQSQPQMLHCLIKTTFAPWLMQTPQPLLCLRHLPLFLKSARVLMLKLLPSLRATNWFLNSLRLLPNGPFKCRSLRLANDPTLLPKQVPFHLSGLSRVW